MRCLNEDCPMGGRSSCPATTECKSFQRTVGIKYPPIAESLATFTLQLSPEEAIEIYTKLGALLGSARIDDFGNPPEYWPSKKVETPDKKTYRYYLYKPTGEIYKHFVEMDDCYIWDKDKKEWREESFDFVQELEFCEHVEKLK